MNVNDALHDILKDCPADVAMAEAERIGMTVKQIGDRVDITGDISQWVELTCTANRSKEN